MSEELDEEERQPTFPTIAPQEQYSEKPENFYRPPQRSFQAEKPKVSARSGTGYHPMKGEGVNGPIIPENKDREERKSPNPLFGGKNFSNFKDFLA